MDPGEAEPVIAELQRRNLKLSGHFTDSPSSGSYRRRARAAAPWAGAGDRPRRCAHCHRTRARCATASAASCRSWDLASRFCRCLGIPLSHIAFWGHGALFCGDTLFSAGCGRMFEGTPKQMNASLNRLRDLPPETAVFCGHEYTAANLRFALTVEPDQQRRPRVPGKRESHSRRRRVPSLPSTLGLEIRVNPFLRCDKPSVRAAAETHAGKPLR